MSKLAAISGRTLCVVVVVVATLNVTLKVAAAQSRAGSTSGACALMSREEVMKTLGRTDLGPSRPEAGPNGDSSCRFPGRIQGSVTIALGAMSRAEFEEFRKLLVDAAYFWDDNRLYALAGKMAVTVSISPTPGTPSSKMKADILALAQAVVPKMNTRQ